MAANHVPSDQLPTQGQSIYSDPSYQNLYSSTERYNTPSWESSLNQHSSVPATQSTQAWHHGSYQPQSYNAYTQPYSGQNHSYQNASPYQYGQFSQQGNLKNFAQNANVDPALGLDPSALRQQQQSPYSNPIRSNTPQNHSGTVTPQALQQAVPSLQNTRPISSSYQAPRSTTDNFAQRPSIASFVKPVPEPKYDMPQGKRSGGMHFLDPAALAKATNSTALNALVTLGSEPFHIATNRTALPLYTPRQSLKDLRRAGADNRKLLAKLSISKSSSSRHSRPKKTPTDSPSNPKQEISDSDSYTDSSSDGSEYTDDEEEEPSPLPSSRPDEPHAAVRYDVIKATWYPRSSSLSSETIKSSMRDIWEVLNTIQKRWRADSKAVSEAEDQKKTGELPVLKSRVTSQRDLLQSALKSALEHAHPDVLYHLGQIKPFLYLCYQFLANRFHSKDYDGSLSSTIFEILAQCGTLTTELLEETKVVKALTSMKKHANDKHKARIQHIIDTATSNTKKAKVSPPPAAESADGKTAKRPAPDPTGRPQTDGSAVKKPKAAEFTTIVVKKINATANGKPLAAVSSSPIQKKPMEKSVVAPAPVKSRVIPAANKASGIFASLNAASKKPVPAPVASTQAKSSAPSKPLAVPAKDKKPVTSASKPAFSFAQTMASLHKPKEQPAAPVKSEKPLPSETPEEKAKRERKEKRRLLRVSWPADTLLCSIKYFHHEPEEDNGHEENFVRDAGDIGGEGRMFKQHKELDVDEEDEEDDLESKPWKEPSSVDFSRVEEDERNRNYAPFGGGAKQPSCPEKEANIRREQIELSVHYAVSNDVPPSPREPVDQADASASAPVVNFGLPDEHHKIYQRAPRPVAQPPILEFNNLENIFKQYAASATAQTAPTPPAPTMPVVIPPPAPTATTTPDLASILAALQVPNASQYQAPVPAPAPVVSSVPQPAAVAAPLAGLDINALVSAIQAQNNGGGGVTYPPPPPGPVPTFFAQPPPQQALDNNGLYQAQAQPQYNQPTNSSTKRSRDESSNNDRGYGKKPKNRGERPHKVLQCRFYPKGLCNKGDNCTYIHDLN